MIYLISDTHFNHKNIIKYENRPFADVAEMNATLIENWNKTVTDDDFVIHLGDVALGSESQLKALVPQLKGHKILIKGNHDTKSRHFYLDCGFEEVCGQKMLLGAGGKIIFLSHRPESRPLDGGIYDLHFFGHVHTKGEYPTICRNGACLCVERWNYTPVCLDTVLDLCEQSTEVEERI